MWKYAIFMESIPYQLLIAYFLFQLRGILVFLDFLQKYLIKLNTGGNLEANFSSAQIVKIYLDWA